jgi:transposase
MVNNNYRNNAYINAMQQKIRAHHNKVWIPRTTANYNEVNSDSWFDIKSANKNEHKTPITHLTYNKPQRQQLLSVKKVKLLLTREQKTIIDNWLVAYTKMYNATLKYFKTKEYNKEHISTSFYKARRDLMNVKNIIHQSTQVQSINRNTKIIVHILDKAIDSVCSSYKSCFTQMRNGTIKHFRIRYIKLTKPIKNMKLELQCFSKNNESFCPSIFNKIEIDVGANDDFKISDVVNIHKHGCILQHDERTNKYILLVPRNTEYIDNDLNVAKHRNRTSNFIGIDPGIRKFLTCITPNKAVKIGTNLSTEISKLLRKIETMKNRNNMPFKIKKKYDKIWNTKIKNLVDDLHWKVIKYITDNNDAVYIGNMSTKSICRGNTLTGITKCVAQRMRYYVFLQRLQYKCSVKRIKLELVDEKYTTKMCSNCGHIKDDLGGAEVYHCDICGITMDRDINGARCCLIKSLCL